jgi:hypothetical protein
VGSGGRHAWQEVCGGLVSTRGDSLGSGRPSVRGEGRRAERGGRRPSISTREGRPLGEALCL